MLDGEPSASLILETSSQLRNAALSSDGRWLAYESDESGRFEVYVRPFPDVDTSRQQVSGAGGYWPVWNPNGQELFYITGENRLVAVAVESEPSLTLGAVVELFDTSPYQTLCLDRETDQWR